MNIVPLEKSSRWALLSTRSLPIPLLHREDFKRLHPLRQRGIAADLRRLEELAVEIDAWFSCSDSEQESIGIGGFLTSLEAHVEVKRENIIAEAPGDNFSWWIFRDSWYPDEFRRQPFVEILSHPLKQRLSDKVPEVGEHVKGYLDWLERQNFHLTESFDELYCAKEYMAVYVHICAILAYVAAIDLGLMRARLSGHYGTPE